MMQKIAYSVESDRCLFIIGDESSCLFFWIAHNYM